MPQEISLPTGPLKGLRSVFKICLAKGTLITALWVAMVLLFLGIGSGENGLPLDASQMVLRASGARLAVGEVLVTGEWALESSLWRDLKATAEAVFASLDKELAGSMATAPGVRIEEGQGYRALFLESGQILVSAVDVGDGKVQGAIRWTGSREDVSYRNVRHKLMTALRQGSGGRVHDLQATTTLVGMILQGHDSREALALGLAAVGARLEWERSGVDVHQARVRAKSDGQTPIEVVVWREGAVDRIVVGAPSIDMMTLVRLGGLPEQGVFSATNFTSITEIDG